MGNEGGEGGLLSHSEYFSMYVQTRSRRMDGEAPHGGVSGGGRDRTVQCTGSPILEERHRKLGGVVNLCGKTLEGRRGRCRGDTASRRIRVA